MTEQLMAVLNSQKTLENKRSIYGVVLNDTVSIQRLAPEMQLKPYLAPPKELVLYIKPQNTWASAGVTVYLPADEDKVEVGACLGVVIGEQNNIDAYVCVADLSLPHASYYRPAIREKCFDDSCVISEAVTSNYVANPNDLLIQTYIDNKLFETRSLNQLIRSIDELINKLSEFITLKVGDILLSGVSYQAPIASGGSTVEVKIDGVASVTFDVKVAQPLNRRRGAS